MRAHRIFARRRERARSGRRRALGGCVAAAVLSMQSFPSPAGPGERAVLRDAPAIEVSQHRVPGSRPPEASARLLIDAPPAVVYAVISDYDRFAEFVPDVQASSVLRAVGARRWVHQIIEMPSLFSAREHVLEALHDESRAAAGRYRIEWHVDAAATSRLVRTGDTVATAAFSGRWELAGVDGGARTDATYVVRFDPGGPLPAWLVSFASGWLLPEVVAAIAARSREAAGPTDTPAERDARDAGSADR